MPYRLFNRVGSGGFVVEAALALAETAFELEELDSRPSTPLPESFRIHNPWRQVPTLILPDGSTMSETAAILIHLSACHQDKELGPKPGTPAHAQFLRWMVFANVNVYEAVLRRPYTERYTTDPNGLKAVREAATLRLGEALSVLEAAIDDGPFLVGKNLSVLDVYVAMLFTWYRGDTQFPKLDMLKASVKGNTIVGPIWQRHFGDR